MFKALKERTYTILANEELVNGFIHVLSAHPEEEIRAILAICYRRTREKHIKLPKPFLLNYYNNLFAYVLEVKKQYYANKVETIGNC